MQWKLSDEQETYRDTLRDWLADLAPTERVREWQESGDASAFRRRFAADGWGGVGVAEAAGGQGGGVVELALTAEELGRADAPSAAWLATMLAVPALAGRPDLAEEAFGGAGIALLAASEGLPNRADGLAVDGAGRVTGRVPRVLGAAEVSSYVVVAGSGEERRLYLLDASAPGVQVSEHRLLDRSRSIADVELAAVPAELLDASVGETLERSTDLAGVLVAADSLGATERMLDMAVAYSGQRRQFGVPIGSFQAVKHAAATIEVGVEAARSAVYYAAASIEGENEERALHAAAVKAQVGAEGARAADSALTIHGAIGYTWEHDLHLFYKRARLDAHLFGAAEVWNERLADRLALV